MHPFNTGQTKIRALSNKSINNLKSYHAFFCQSSVFFSLTNGSGRVNGQKFNIHGKSGLFCEDKGGNTEFRPLIERKVCALLVSS